jgi:hypothetical protein
LGRVRQRRASVVPSQLLTYPKVQANQLSVVNQ